MDTKTKEMIRGWLQMHRGNVEELARWMRSTLPVGIRDARTLIAEACQ
jgi:hypothetical protein